MSVCHSALTSSCVVVSKFQFVRQAATGAANAVREGGSGEAGSHDNIAAAVAKGVQAATQGK